MNATDTNKFASQIRTQATNLLTTIDNLQALRNKADAINAGATLEDADLGGDNAGMTWAADLLPVIYATLDQFKADLAAGHATNLHRAARLD